MGYEELRRQLDRARAREPRLAAKRERILARLEHEDSPRRVEGLRANLANIDAELEVLYELSLPGDGDVTVSPPTGSISVEGQANGG